MYNSSYTYYNLTPFMHSLICCKYLKKYIIHIHTEDMNFLIVIKCSKIQLAISLILYI